MTKLSDDISESFVILIMKGDELIALRYKYLSPPTNKNIKGAVKTAPYHVHL